MLRETKTVAINRNVSIGGGSPLCIIAGPCVIENIDMLHSACSFLKKAAAEAGFSYVFKTSYDKANRTSAGAYRGPGLKKGLAMIAEVKKAHDVPVLVDVHREEEIAEAAAVADVLQVPAFLCRQTDFVGAVARSGRVVNIKKGQFVAPADAAFIAEKAASEGNTNIILTERGFSFGYNNLVFDPRSLFLMKKSGYPVVFDATHSVQLPSGSKGTSGGVRELVIPYSRAAYATGIDGLFLEVHENPDAALCDGPNMLDYALFSELIAQLGKLGTGIYGSI